MCGKVCVGGIGEDDVIVGDVFFFVDFFDVWLFYFFVYEGGRDFVRM